MRKTIRFIPLTSFASLVLANIAHAATFASVVTNIGVIFNQIIGLLIGLGVFFLAFGIFRYIGAGGDQQRRVEGRNLFLWGLVALFVMVSFWGLLNLLMASFFDQNTLQYPEISRTLYPNQ